MTIQQLLADPRFRGYFCFDPSGVIPNSNNIDKSTAAHEFSRGKPEGWRTGRVCEQGVVTADYTGSGSQLPIIVV